MGNPDPPRDKGHKRLGFATPLIAHTPPGGHSRRLSEGIEARPSSPIVDAASMLLRSLVEQRQCGNPHVFKTLASARGLEWQVVDLTNQPRAVFYSQDE